MAKSTTKIKDKKWTKKALIAANKKGIITNSFMEKKLKELGISREDLLKMKITHPDHFTPRFKKI